MRQLTALNTVPTYRFDKSQQLLNALFYGAYVPENRVCLEARLTPTSSRSWERFLFGAWDAPDTPEDYARSVMPNCKSALFGPSSN